MIRTTNKLSMLDRVIATVILCFVGDLCSATVTEVARGGVEMFERTFESHKVYTDPFNDVDVDVIFSKSGNSWRVPAFWRGSNKWTVRFSPPAPGVYQYHLESTDKGNPDLNEHADQIAIAPYSGTNDLLRHGMLQVSSNGRYFEHADGTPFYWLGDAWWTGLSDRLDWKGFQQLTADRRAKGFTVVQINAGLAPPEELAPVDPGFCNEGGCVWDRDFRQINPKFFDYADRRIQYLIASGIVPAIVGGWSTLLWTHAPTEQQVSVAKMKQHWRYIIGRYGAYPVFWIAGGEVDVRNGPGWTDVVRYIRATDPYRHPATVLDLAPPRSGRNELLDESLKDFDLLDCGYFSGWPTIAVEVALVNSYYARTSVTKPVVVGENGPEMLVERNYPNFQRAAFWLSMLNGAAGHTYSAIGTWEAYTADKPLHRFKWSFLTWKEGMNLPGSYQVGLGAKLLRQYPWWRFEPHPEWVAPHGTTLLEPHSEVDQFDVLGSWEDVSEEDIPRGEWKARNGTFHLPYAAGIPGEVRFIYIPHFSFAPDHPPPTVLDLEPGVRYHAYFWEPALGIRIDMGAVQRPAMGARLFEDRFAEGKSPEWKDNSAGSSVRGGGRLSLMGELLTVVGSVTATNGLAAVDAQSKSWAALVMRYDDGANFVAAVYSSEEKALYMLDRQGGVDGRPLGRTPIPTIGARIRLTAEVRDRKGAVSITDGQRTYTTPIVDLGNARAGSFGLLHRGEDTQQFENFELQRSPALIKDDETLPTKLYDARGEYRGDLAGAPGASPEGGDGWDNFRDKNILLNAYRPERLPVFGGDWILVLESSRRLDASLIHRHPDPLFSKGAVGRCPALAAAGPSGRASAATGCRRRTGITGGGLDGRTDLGTDCPKGRVPPCPSPASDYLSLR